MNNLLTSAMFDADMMSFNGDLNPSPQPPQQPSKRKRSNATTSNSTNKGKQIRMDQANAINLESDVDDAFEELFSDVGAKEVPPSSSMTRKLNNGVVTITSPTPNGATHFIKIEVYDMKDIEGKSSNEIWRHASVRSKVFINRIENPQTFNIINTITLDLAKKMKNAEGSETKFMKF